MQPPPADGAPAAWYMVCDYMPPFPTPPADGPEAAVLAAYERGQARWPGCAATLTAFAARVERMRVSAAALEAHAEDLFLVLSASQGDPVALAAIETLLRAEVPGHLARFRLSDDGRDEVLQLTRIRLLAGPTPRLELYAGQGPLGAFVRVVAIRTTLNFLAVRRPDSPNETVRPSGVFDAIIDAPASQELQLIRARYRERVQAALERGFASLDARDRTLLRMNVADGQSIDVIARVYKTHRATAARWLASIRRRLVEELHRELAVELRSTPHEAQSLMRLFADELRISVSRLLPKTS